MGCGPTGEGVLLGGSDGVELHVCTLLSEEDDQREDQGEMDPDLQLEDEGEDEVGSEAHWDEQYIGGVALVL